MDSYFEEETTGTVQYPFCCQWAPDGSIAVMMSSVIHILHPQFSAQRLYRRAWINLDGKSSISSHTLEQHETNGVTVKQWLKDACGMDSPYGPMCFRAIAWSKDRMPLSAYCVLAVLFSTGKLLLSEMSLDGQHVRQTLDAHTLCSVDYVGMLSSSNKLSEVFSEWTSFFSTTVTADNDHIRSLSWLPNTHATEISRDCSMPLRPCLLLATASSHIVMLWAVVRDSAGVATAVASRPATDTPECAVEEEGLATLPVGVFLLADMLLAFNIDAQVEHGHPLTMSILGSITCVCCIKTGTATTDSTESDADTLSRSHICSIVLGTASGYVFCMELHHSAPTASPMKLTPCSYAVSDSTTSRTKHVTVKQNLSLRPVWCVCVCRRAVEHIVTAQGYNGGAMLTVQYGQYFSLLDVGTGLAVAGFGGGAVLTEGDSEAQIGLQSSTNIAHGDIISGMSVTRVRNFSTSGQPTRGRGAPIVLTAGINGNIIEWTGHSTASEGPKIISPCPSSSAIATNRVVSGLCTDPGQLMYAYVSDMQPREAGKRFGNPKVHKLTLKTLSGTQLDSMSDVDKLSDILEDVLNALLRQQQCYFDLSGWVMYILHELSRLGNDPSRRFSLGTGERDWRISVGTPLPSFSTNAGDDNDEPKDRGGDRYNGRSRRKRRCPSSPKTTMHTESVGVNLIDMEGGEESGTVKVLGDDALVHTYEHMLSACDAGRYSTAVSVTPSRPVVEDSGASLAAASSPVAATVGWMVRAVCEAAARVCAAREEMWEGPEVTYDQQGGYLSELIHFRADKERRRCRVALWQCLHSCFRGMYNRHLTAAHIIGSHRELAAAIDALRTCVRLAWTEQFLTRACEYFHMDEFETKASSNEDVSNDGSSVWYSAFPIPSLKEAQCIYLAAQWAFATIAAIVGPAESTEPSSVSPLPRIVIDNSEALLLQAKAVNCMVYTERVRLLFYSSDPLGFASVCEVCEAPIELQSLACGERVLCGSCGVTTECCAYTFRPVSTTCELLLDKHCTRRCPLCSSLSLYKYNYGGASETQGGCEFGWVPYESVPSMCLYCVIALDYVS